MGWSAGRHLADRVWRAIKDAVPESELDRVCQAIAEAFLDLDCDTLDELDNPIGDAARDLQARGEEAARG